MRVVLCEKPSQASDIAKVIGASKRGKGCFLGEGIVVTYCIGHLLEDATPEDYEQSLSQWSLEDLPIIPKAWKMRVKAKTKAQLAIVKSLLADASDLVIATDPDREGELIAWEVIEYCNYTGPASRMHLSALNTASIRKAWTELKPAADSITRYHSALARARSDWLVGMNLSRLFTLLGAQAGYHGVLSIGRVQTPTLRIVVDRDRAIANFTPAPFWDLKLKLPAPNGEFSAQWVPPDHVTDEQGRCVCPVAASSAESVVRSSRTAIVHEVGDETVREPAPLPFSLGDLQQACSAKLGLDVQETLDIAQSLYETHKATTYPRADNGYLDESMFEEVPLVFAALAKTDSSISSLLLTLDQTLKSRAWNSTKVTAHHGIIPTIEPACIERMTDKEAAVYRLIRGRFLAQFAGDHIVKKREVSVLVEDLVFRARGREVLSPGWKTIAADDGREDDDDKAQAAVSQQLPGLARAQQLSILTTELRKLKTEAPRPFTQGELIGAMKGAAKLVSDSRLKKILRETTGIGTEATRAGIITNLIARGFLVKKGKTLKASDAAFSLIDAAPSAVSDPGMTAIWEQALSLVEEGQMPLEDFVAKQSLWVQGMVQKYAGVRMTFNLPQGPVCPLCGGQTRKRNGPNGMFWACCAYPVCKGSVDCGSNKKGRVAAKKSRKRAA